MMPDSQNLTKISCGFSPVLRALISHINTDRGRFEARGTRPGIAARTSLSKHYPDAICDRPLRMQRQPSVRSRRGMFAQRAQPAVFFRPLLPCDIPELQPTEHRGFRHGRSRFHPALGSSKPHLPPPSKTPGERFGASVIREHVFGQDYARTLAI